MKILIKADAKIQEELEALGCGLSELGHEVILFNDSIFRVADETKPDLVIITENNKSSDIDKYNIKKYIYEKPTQRVANTVKFKPQLYNEKISTDLLVINVGDVHKVMIFVEQIRYKVKICGGLVPSPYFVGLTQLHEISQLAHSAKVVYCDNDIIRDSFLMNNICATSELNMVMGLLENIEKREDYIQQQKKNIIVEKEMAGIIYEKLRNIN
jgi:hypothetical protein